MIDILVRLGEVGDAHDRETLNWIRNSSALEVAGIPVNWSFDTDLLDDCQTEIIKLRRENDLLLDMHRIMFDRLTIADAADDARAAANWNPRI
jgi:hypothetical protein